MKCNDNEAIKAVIDGKIVGGLSYEYDTANNLYIRTVFVNKAYRGAV